MGTLYENISQACSQKGVSVYRMCKDIGIRNSILTDLHKGRTSTLRADTLEKIASYLSVPQSVLLGGEEITINDELNEYRQMLVDRPEMKMLFDTAKGATKEQVEAIVNMLDAMRGNK